MLEEPRLSTFWLFRRKPEPSSAWDVIVWWELRRIPFNFVIGAWGVTCVAILDAAISAAHVLGPGEDSVEPMALFAASLAINVLYTLGWLVEVPARMIAPSLSMNVGTRLMQFGLGLGLSLIALPALFWTGYVGLQILRVVP